MFEQICEDQAHPYHPCAAAMLEAKSARERRNQLTLASLRRDRGRITRISWDQASDMGDEGQAIEYPECITVHLEDGTSLSFPESNLQLSFSDGYWPEHEGEPLLDIDEDFEDPRAEVDRRLAQLTGIPVDRLHAYFWLANCHLYQVFQDQTETSLDIDPAEGDT